MRKAIELGGFLLRGRNSRIATDVPAAPQQVVEPVVPSPEPEDAVVNPDIIEIETHPLNHRPDFVMFANNWNEYEGSYRKRMKDSIAAGVTRVEELRSPQRLIDLITKFEDREQRRRDEVNATPLGLSKKEKQARVVYATKKAERARELLERFQAETSQELADATAQVDRNRQRLEDSDRSFALRAEPQRVLYFALERIFFAPIPDADGEESSEAAQETLEQIRQSRQAAVDNLFALAVVRHSPRMSLRDSNFEFFLLQKWYDPQLMKDTDDLRHERDLAVERQKAILRNLGYEHRVW